MTAAGLGYPATRPALARLAHIRAVLAARLWLQAAPAWTHSRAVVAFRAAPARRPARSRRRHRAPARRRDPLAQHRRQPVRRAGLGHRGRADPQAAARTTAIMAGLLPGPARYAQVIYLTAPAARPVVTRSADGFPQISRPGS